MSSTRRPSTTIARPSASRRRASGELADPLGDAAHEGRVAVGAGDVVGERRRVAGVLAVDLQQAQAEAQAAAAHLERGEAAADPAPGQEEVDRAAAAQARVGRHQRGDGAADDGEAPAGPTARSAVAAPV